MSYSIAQAERLTGIKAHTLRIWERRYDFLSPERTETNIRYFTDDQLRKLINVSILVNNNFRISKIAEMSDERIHEIVNEILSTEDPEKEEIIKSLVLSMIDLDEDVFNNIFNRLILRNGLLHTVTQIIYPFLAQVGVLWGTNKVLPAQEHFTSNLIRQKIISATESLPSAPANAPSIVFFLLEDESHEIGLLLGSFVAKDMGWKTYYLGQNVPSDNMEAVIQRIKPDLLTTMFILPRNKKSDSILCDLLENYKIPLLYSGPKGNNPCENKSQYHVHISSPEKYLEYLSDFKQNYQKI